MTKDRKTKSLEAARSRRYREKKAVEKQQLKEQLAQFMAMTPAQIHAIMGYKPVNMHIFTSLAQAQCTKSEIAAALGMKPDTLALRLKENPMLEDVYQRARMYGVASLRRKQFDVAMLGHPRMLEWLGKQVLGQTDKVETVEPNAHEKFVRQMQEAMPDAFDVTPLPATLTMDGNPNLEPA